MIADVSRKKRLRSIPEDGLSGAANRAATIVGLVLVGLRAGVRRWKWRRREHRPERRVPSIQDGQWRWQSPDATVSQKVWRTTVRLSEAPPEAPLAAGESQADLPANGSGPADGSGPGSVSEPECGLQTTVVLIESRTFIRDAIVQSLEKSMALRVVPVADVSACIKRLSNSKLAAIVHSASGLGEVADTLIIHQLKALAEIGCALPSVVIADCADGARVIEVFNNGAKGYIPTNLSLSVAAHVIRLVAAGGNYVPASCLLDHQPKEERVQSVEAPVPCFNGIFTARQTAVIEAIRRGKANKIIAYELEMRESTVKVHVRNIMKKLNAKNRTEVAYRANELLAASGQGAAGDLDRFGRRHGHDGPPGMVTV